MALDAPQDELEGVEGGGWTLDVAVLWAVTGPGGSHPLVCGYELGLCRFGHPFHNGLPEHQERDRHDIDGFGPELDEPARAFLTRD